MKKILAVGAVLLVLLLAGCIGDKITAPTAQPTKGAQTTAQPSAGGGATQATAQPPAQPTSVDGVRLSVYNDSKYYFSVSKPDSWSVSSGDEIVVKDGADATSKVVIHPVFLSGTYRSMSASDIANYLIGKEKQNYQSFNVESVRESADNKVLELVATFSEQGVAKKAVYTVFVNSPYAMLSSYETSADKFAEREELLRKISESYRQATPPAPEGQAAQATAQAGPLGQLQKQQLANGVTMAMPQGWTASVLPGCSGLIATDPAKARSVAFLNGLHQSVQPLPPGVTPEDYVTTYMQQDFNTMSNVQIVSYEEADLSQLQAASGPGVTIKAMRIAFDNQGIPTTGSFTVGTYQTGISTSVAYLWGLSAPTDEFQSVGGVLKAMFDSIDYSTSSLGACRQALNSAWESANQVGEAIRKTGEEIRQEQLQQYQERQNTNDEFLEKFSDFTLNRDRVYNPDTNEVYEVSQNFYDYYDKNRQSYDYSNMRELQPSEWLQYAPLNGELRIH